MIFWSPVAVPMSAVPGWCVAARAGRSMPCAAARRRSVSSSGEAASNDSASASLASLRVPMWKVSSEG